MTKSAKRTQQKQRSVLLTLGLVCLVFLSVFLLRSWIRTTVFPHLVGTVIGDRLTSLQREQVEQVQSVLPAVSVRGAGRPECVLDWADGFTTIISCFATTMQDTGSMTRVNVSMENLREMTNKLHELGWSPSVGNSFVSPRGVDISHKADISLSYERTVDKINCRLNYSAYKANIEQPQFEHTSFLLTCSRKVSLF
jgi:hypothetical protein